MLAPRRAEALEGHPMMHGGVARAQEEAVVRHGVRVRVVGDLSLLPEGVQAAAQVVMEATAHHAQGTLNICFSYGWGASLTLLGRVYPGKIIKPLPVPSPPVCCRAASTTFCWAHACTC